MSVIDRPFADLTASEFHDILKLRIDVFVVEQECAYRELDGRDTERGTRHVWLADASGPTAYVRLLDDGDARRIGRVVTRPDARGSGVAGQLVDYLVSASAGPWVLDAQSYLAEWYSARGFDASGPEFVEDGIPHVPMRRAT